MDRDLEGRKQNLPSCEVLQPRESRLGADQMRGLLTDRQDVRPVPWQRGLGAM